jgi:DNA-binding SARP family transcriptional activator/ABC-type branched-subunit amino acid transport system substrate-binding protein/streptogramin lyase
VEFLILGPLEARRSGRPISFGGGKQRALLALLLLNANETVSTERLIDELWGERPPATAAKIVQNYVSRLRSAIAADGVLVTHGSGYELRVKAGETDVDRFEERLAAGRHALARGEAQEASRTLREALALWRGPALSDFTLEDFAQSEIARLEERRLVALEERIEADLALGRHRDLVGELETLIAEHPFRERLRGQLMVALYRSGRQSEALHAFQDARKRLSEELGLEPGPALQRLEHAILQQDRSLDLTELPTGAVTFLFTDIEGSTALVKTLRAEYRGVLADHARLLRGVFEQHAGHEIDTQGDSFFVAFQHARNAVMAAVAAQRALAEHDWPGDTQIRVRMGIHTGQAEVAEDRYLGLSVHRAARIGAAGHGGQVLVSQTTQNLLEDEEEDLPDVELEDLGIHRLKDLDRPVHLYQAVAPGLRSDFPPLRVQETVPARVSRTRALLLTGGVVLAGGALVLAAALTRGSDSQGLASVAANSVGVIDSETSELLDGIAVGKTPTSVAVGEGAVWALNADDQTISRIDPETRQVENFAIGRTPTDIAVGEGALWVGNGIKPSAIVGHPVATSVSKVDPARTTPLREPIELPKPQGALSNLVDDHIAVGAGAVWVINPDASLSRIDSQTGEVTRIGDVRAAAVAASGSTVWVLNVDSTIARVDPRTNRVARPIVIPATTLSDIAIGDGSIWLAAPYDRRVWRVTPGPRLVMTTITVGLGVDRIAFGEGSLWTTNSLRGTVSRVDPDREQVARTISVGNTPRGLAVGEGRVWVSVAGAGGGRLPAATPSSQVKGIDALPRSICGNVFYGGEGSPDYLIVSDLPLQSGSAFPALQMAEAIGFVLRKHAFRAGRYRVAYQSCDDSTAQTGNFDSDKCASNAKEYGDNPDVIGVIGPFNSGCAFSLIPVANEAPDGPLPVVSPTSSIVGLTRAAPRAPRGALERLYPTGRRNYVRVFPTEDSQSAANALLARQLGLRRVFVLHDGDESFGLAKAIYFQRAARRLGLRIVGFRAWDPAAVGYAPLAEDVARARPDGVFLGGGTYSNGGLLLRDLRDELGAEVKVFAAEFVPIADLFDRAGPSARGSYVSFPGLTIDRLPPAGRRFAREFGAIQPGGRVEVSSVYAAQATELLLAAIARSDGSRASVTRELLGARVSGGILGDFRITPTGDTTAQPITILRAVRGGAEERIMGYEGGQIVRVISPPPRLTR